MEKGTLLGQKTQSNQIAPFSSQEAQGRERMEMSVILATQRMIYVAQALSTERPTLIQVGNEKSFP